MVQANYGTRRDLVSSTFFEESLPIDIFAVFPHILPMDTNVLTFIRQVPKSELQTLHLQTGERLIYAFDCEDQVPVVNVFHDDSIEEIAVPARKAG